MITAMDPIKRLRGLENPKVPREMMHQLPKGEQRNTNLIDLPLKRSGLINHAPMLYLVGVYRSRCQIRVLLRSYRNFYTC